MRSSNRHPGARLGLGTRPHTAMLAPCVAAHTFDTTGTVMSSLSARASLQIISGRRELAFSIGFDMHILPCSGRHTVVKRQPFVSKRGAHDATSVKFKTWLVAISDRRRQSVSRTRPPPRPPGNQRSQGQHRPYDRIGTLWACVDANRAIHLS